jgi:hypothetical protein
LLFLQKCNQSQFHSRNIFRHAINSDGDDEIFFVAPASHSVTLKLLVSMPQNVLLRH